jgi:hypothetical protein
MTNNTSQKLEIVTRLLKQENISLIEAVILLKDDISLKSDIKTQFPAWYSSDTNYRIHFDENSN